VILAELAGRLPGCRWGGEEAARGGRQVGYALFLVDRWTVPRNSSARRRVTVNSGSGGDGQPVSVVVFVAAIGRRCGGNGTKALDCR